MQSSADWFAHFKPPNGFSKVAIAGLYSTLPNQSAKVWKSLSQLMNLDNVSPNAQYWEANHAPCNESPLGWAFQVSQLFLRSWNAGVVEVFPNAPTELQNVEFYRLRTEGGFLVSASRQNSTTKFVAVESEAGLDLKLRLDVSLLPPFDMDAPQGVSLSCSAQSLCSVHGIKRGQQVVIWSKTQGRPTEGFHISAVDASQSAFNAWGKHPKTDLREHVKQSLAEQTSQSMWV